MRHLVKAFLIVLLTFICSEGTCSKSHTVERSEESKSSATPVPKDRVIEAIVKLQPGNPDEPFVQVVIPNQKIIAEQVVVPLAKAQADPRPAN